MWIRSWGRVLIAILCSAPLGLLAQDFKLFDRDFQVHGFASQGFVYTNENNWLTMPTSVGSGSAQMTDFGANVSVPVTDKFRAGAQIYDRNLGQLGKWHPSLDWAYASYKFKPWFAIRGGKVKTVLGLFNDTQDLDFLHPFALLPQSIYPTDMRDSTIAHTGGDVYGDIRLKNHLGTLSYTAYAGERKDSQYGGYPYLLKTVPIAFTSYGGLQYGGDLRWATPLKGLLIGASRMDEDITGRGTTTLFGPAAPYEEHSNADWTNQFYGEYTVGKLQVDSEWRRYWRDQQIFNGLFRVQTDVRGVYVAGSYRFTKWFQIGSYYSRYSISLPVMTLPGVPGGQVGHIYDPAVTARFDLNRYLNIKVEGHFMDGSGLPQMYPAGFYLADNPAGFKPNTNALVIKTGFNF
ncbi:MAG: hypothetical protein ACHP9V_00765 [Terriglobales bacterium]